jgi:RNA polymerase sigma-70 factor, ECF subfamily
LKPSSDAEPGLVPDSALVKRFADSGDHAAFEELVMRHLPSLRKFLAVRLGPGFDREEAEQEVLVRLHGSLRGFAHRSSFTTYLFRLCANVSADMVRKRQRDRRREAKLYLLRADADPRPGDDPWTGLGREETSRAVMEALQALGEPDRSILYLRDAEDSSVEEIMGIFGLPSGTVKSKLSRAREKMKRSLVAAGCGAEA